MRLARLERLATDEVVVRSQVDREPDPRLERVDLVVELVAGEDQARLDAEDVERLEAERRQAVLLARLPDRVPDRRAVGRVAPDLVAELARVARARDHDRDPVERPDTPDREPEPADVLERRLRRRRPHDLLQQLAACRPLDREVVELVGGRLDPDLQLVAVRELLEPDAVVLVAADEAEVVLAEPVDRRVVDHPARLVAEGRVRDLPDGQPPRVARDRLLDERLRVWPEDLPLAERRDVHDRDLLAAGPVLGDRAPPGGTVTV